MIKSEVVTIITTNPHGGDECMKKEEGRRERGRRRNKVYLIYKSILDFSCVILLSY